MVLSQVVPMPRKPPKPGELIKVIHRLAEAGAVGFSAHAFRDRSEARGIDFPDALAVLKRGYISGEIEPGINIGEWTCKVIDKAEKSSRWIGVPVVVIRNARLLIITVEWEDTK
jgi:hypothetical protein